MIVEVYTHDPILTLVRLPEESLDMYCGDREYYEGMLECHGVDIPDELVREISETYNRLIELSRQVEERYRARRRT